VVRSFRIAGHRTVSRYLIERGRCKESSWTRTETVRKMHLGKQRARIKGENKGEGLRFARRREYQTSVL